MEAGGGTGWGRTDENLLRRKDRKKPEKREGVLRRKESPDTSRPTVSLLPRVIYSVPLDPL